MHQRAVEDLPMNITTRAIVEMEEAGPLDKEMATVIGRRSRHIQVPLTWLVVKFPKFMRRLLVIGRHS